MTESASSAYQESASSYQFNCAVLALRFARDDTGEARRWSSHSPGTPCLQNDSCYRPPDASRANSASGIRTKDASEERVRGPSDLQRGATRCAARRSAAQRLPRSRRFPDACLQLRLPQCRSDSAVTAQINLSSVIGKSRTRRPVA